MEQTLGRVDCERTVQRVLAGLESSIGHAEATIEVGSLPVVIADPTQLEQMFQNLLANALKFRGTQPARIEISSEPTMDGYIFSIADHGIGIKRDYREQIFKMFTRLHSREEYVGIGAGLAICRQIAIRNGGRIWVEDTPGGGSTFRFALSEPTGDMTVKQPVDYGRAVRVLLVEDNPADVRLLREALADGKVDIELEVAGDGEDAIALLTASIDDPSRRPDLVLLDLNLPRKTGGDVLAEIKGSPVLRRMPVIVLSGSSAHHDVRNAYDLHANAYLRKPRDYPGLRQLVEEIERFWLAQALLPI